MQKIKIREDLERRFNEVYDSLRKAVSNNTIISKDEKFCSFTLNAVKAEKGDVVVYPGPDSSILETPVIQVTKQNDFDKPDTWTYGQERDVSTWETISETISFADQVISLGVRSDIISNSIEWFLYQKNGLYKMAMVFWDGDYTWALLGSSRGKSEYLELSVSGKMISVAKSSDRKEQRRFWKNQLKQL